jgi:hypothetical protein
MMFTTLLLHMRDEYFGSRSKFLQPSSTLILTSTSSEVANVGLVCCAELEVAQPPQDSMLEGTASGMEAERCALDSHIASFPSSQAILSASSMYSNSTAVQYKEGPIESSTISVPPDSLQYQSFDTSSIQSPPGFSNHSHSESGRRVPVEELLVGSAAVEPGIVDLEGVKTTLFSFGVSTSRIRTWADNSR